MKKNIGIALLFVLVVSACTPTSKKATSSAEAATSQATSQNIEYKIAKNYFVKNTVKALVPAKITTQEDFDKYFGPATVMGENGQPTKIDFNKEYVIVVDHATTSKETEITPLALLKRGQDVVLQYSVKEGGDIGYQHHPFLMLVVDKANSGEVVLEKMEPSAAQK